MNMRTNLTHRNLVSKPLEHRQYAERRLNQYLELEEDLRIEEIEQSADIVVNEDFKNNVRKIKSDEYQFYFDY